MSKILVVDDDIITIQLIEFLLKKNNYEVITASDGEEGYEKIIKENPDLVLLDVMLPKINGIEVCEKVKENKLENPPPIILLTALGQDVEVVKGIKAGAISYITKPFDPKQVIKKIKDILNSDNEIR